MEYTQMTLDDWLSLKEGLLQDIQSAQDKINGARRDFVRIGYKLRKINDERLYEKDGYKSIAEFAKVVCNLQSYEVTRFMQINEKFSIGGYSEELRPELLGYGQSKLTAMLALPEEDLQMITPEASRENIRELGRFNKAEPETGVADDIRELIEKFYETNPEILNGVFQETDLKKRIEIVNPGGNKSFKKGLYFMMMYENKVVIKKFGGTPQEMNWEEFFEQTEEIFGLAAGPDTWQNYFGEPESEQKEPEHEEEPKEEPETAAEEQQCTGQMELTRDMPEYCPNPAKEEIAPAQNEEQEDDKNTTTDRTASEPQHKESKPETAAEEPENGVEVINPPEVMEKPFGTRKDYLDTLTVYGAAMYLAQEYGRHNLHASSLAYPTELEKWLGEEVDEKGYSIEEED